MTTPAVEVSSLTVHYGDLLALDDVSLTLAPGRVCGLIGMNGAGKSTLMKAVLGVVRPDTGQVRLDGLSPARARRSNLLGYMPQSEDVDWGFPLSVRDVVLTGRYGHLGFTRRPRPADRDAVDAALDRVGLTDLADRQIGQLSGGQRKRVFVARGIAQEARVLLLDEPFAGIDTTSEATITRLLRELAADGVTVLVSTHDLHALPALADEAVLLRRRVLRHGPPEEVLAPETLALAFGLEAESGGAPLPALRQAQGAGVGSTGSATSPQRAEPVEARTPTLRQAQGAGVRSTGSATPPQRAEPVEARTPTLRQAQGAGVRSTGSATPPQRAEPVEARGPTLRQAQGAGGEQTQGAGGEQTQGAGGEQTQGAGSEKTQGAGAGRSPDGGSER